MTLFRLCASSHATARELKGTSAAGPFLVLAESRSWARRLVSMNYAMAVRRHPGERIAVPVWSDLGPNDCIEINDVDVGKIDRGRLRGADSALAPLCRPALEVDGTEVARMIWW